MHALPKLDGETMLMFQVPGSEAGSEEAMAILKLKKEMRRGFLPLPKPEGSPGFLFSVPVFLISAVALRFFFNWHRN